MGCQHTWPQKQALWLYSVTWINVALQRIHATFPWLSLNSTTSWLRINFSPFNSHVQRNRENICFHLLCLKFSENRVHVIFQKKLKTESIFFIPSPITRKVVNLRPWLTFHWAVSNGSSSYCYYLAVQRFLPAHLWQLFQYNGKKENEWHFSGLLKGSLELSKYKTAFRNAASKGTAAFLMTAQVWWVFLPQFHWEIQSNSRSFCLLFCSWTSTHKKYALNIL